MHVKLMQTEHLGCITSGSSNFQSLIGHARLSGENISSCKHIWHCLSWLILTRSYIVLITVYDSMGLESLNGALC